MPRLLLLRHAKSAWDEPDADDYDRPLNTRGRRSAPLMGRHCAQHNLVPQLILCSSARRTRETLAGLLPYFADDLDVRLCRDLYMTSAATAFERLKAVSDAAKSVMLIGHNPALQQLAVDLIGSGNPALREEIGDKFPTAALCVIDFDARRWADVTSRTGRIVAFFRPRELFMVDGETGDVDE
ncbi:MAG: histidine phosphatase family protein [Ancalomicrobiaceae bacterium]|nr:histidine phosphatase family protein [Ancalomicrobiaceae bacterium]